MIPVYMARAIEKRKEEQPLISLLSHLASFPSFVAVSEIFKVCIEDRMHAGYRAVNPSSEKRGGVEGDLGILAGESHDWLQ